MSQFAFKQFIIGQNHAAMKVSTDGILLGAWAPLNGAGKIIDVGSGTGLLSLMLKQRAPQSEVHAVELDNDAIFDAKQNIAQSPWPDIQLHHCAIQKFDAQGNFDLMISNPPYFNDSLKAQTPQRSRARHTDSLSFLELLQAFKQLTNPNGHLAIVLPLYESEHICEVASKVGVFVIKRCEVKATPKKAVSRCLLYFSKIRGECVSSELTIYDQQNHYSDDYVALCREFYLKM